MAHSADTQTIAPAHRGRRIAQLLAGTAAVAVLALSTGTAHAEDNGTGTSSGKAARLAKVCAKVPTIEGRIDAAITRLQGDASVQGSLAWLQVKLDKANAAGRTQAISVLENRMQVRTQTLALLQTKQQNLAKIAQVCADNGLGA
jgi:division protein CdvB (Snf7/Vps24/ESCRT-III family)